MAKKKKTTRQELENQVVRSLQDIEEDLSCEYREALEHAPALVQNESRICDFLQAESQDPTKAAIRLANYWKTRKE